MSTTPNEQFSRFIEFLLSGKIDVAQRSADTEEYKQFINDFPASKLASLTLDQYCIGTGKNDSFCWWVERGLQPVLGRYMPGTSRGHIIYRKDDGSIYKNRLLRMLSDEEALQYTLKIHAIIANAKATEDLRWIDDDQEIYGRAEVKPLMTCGEGRKLRILSCYHPDDILPISSSDHLGHFLTVFGLLKSEIPSVKEPVSRMLLLWKFFETARKQIPGLSTYGFMKALYSKDLSIAPPPRKESQTKKGAENASEVEADQELQDEEADDDMDSQTEVNLILYGPPGTGKTYTTIDEALKIIDPIFFDENANARPLLRERFDDLMDSKQIRFVTFHQSFSYEDFIEGLRAETDDDTKQINYKVEDGVFKTICLDAQKQTARNAGPGVSDSPRIWKISIVGTYENDTKKYCYAKGEARIGWGHVGDLTKADLTDPSLEIGSNDRSCLRNFSQDIQPGDILLCISSNSEVGGVGVVQGDYIYDVNPPSGIPDSYKHVRKVNWILKDIHFSILPLNGQVGFTQKTVYEMWRINWTELAISLQKAGYALSVPNAAPEMQEPDKPHVLIIDEINRGNISRIFGELITLIEPSKRAGTAEALSVTLPYSKKTFSVPSNVYLIGTMNTADRSLAGLDIALRRRFSFKEMPPKPEFLDAVTIGGVNIGNLLRKMNERIEILLDRDHCLGHTYFLPLRKNGSVSELKFIFRQQIMPLLQEYFFEDWERIAWILNDQNKPIEQSFVQKASSDLVGLFGRKIAEDLQNVGQRWRINEKAFDNIESYRGILGGGT